ncbi:MAG: hypothetical protein HY288_16255 [Planctomycetia bacterium]|nr:hypothetical protein [Planctomycetia bacterium]
MIGVIAVVGSTVLAARPENVEVITWESRNQESDGVFERLIVGSNGRSEILVARLGKPGKPKPGWTVRDDGLRSYYRRMNPLPEAEAKRRFTDAVAAGVKELQPFPSSDDDDIAVVVTIRGSSSTTEFVIPASACDQQSDNNRSENHRRFFAVEKILGSFDVDAFQSLANGAEPEPDMISWWVGGGGPGDGSRCLTLWSDGTSETIVESSGGRMKPKAGWTVTKTSNSSFGFSTYRRENPVPPSDVKKKFRAAVAAGVEQLKSIKPRGIVFDAASTVITMRVRGRYKQVAVSAATSAIEPAKVKSENYRRFLAIRDILGTFDTDAFEVPPAVIPPRDPNKLSMISWEVIHGPPEGGSDRVILWEDGHSEFVVKRSGNSQKVKAGWTVESKDGWKYFRKVDSLSEAEGRDKFSLAQSMGINRLVKVPARRSNVKEIHLTVRWAGKENSTILPEFKPGDETDNYVHANNVHFLQIEQLLSGFDTNAFEAQK